MNKRTIDLSGHIIDSLMLTKTMGIIMDKGGEFDILEIEVGRKKSDTSHAKIEVSADSPELLESILDELSVLGASIDEIKELNYNIDLCGYPYEEEEVLPPMQLLENYQKQRAEIDKNIDDVLGKIKVMLENK